MDFELDVECSADTESQCPTSSGASLSLAEVIFSICKPIHSKISANSISVCMYFLFIYLFLTYFVEVISRILWKSYLPYY